MSRAGEAPRPTQFIGRLGILRVSYQEAIRFSSWSLTLKYDELGGGPAVLTAKANFIDDFWSTQGPMRLGLFMGDIWWVWNEARLQGTPSLARVEALVEGEPTAQVHF